MRAFRLLELLAVLAMTAVAGCGSEGSTSPTPQPSTDSAVVTTTVDRDPIPPGEVVFITARAEPTGSASVKWIVVVMSGAIERRDSVTYSGEGPQTLFTSVRVPGHVSSGTLDITTSVSVGEKVVTDVVSFRIRDREPPIITLYEANKSTASPSDTVGLTLVASDTAGVSRIILRVQNSFFFADTILVDPPAKRLEQVLRLIVPDDAVVGFPAQVSVVVNDMTGLTAWREVDVNVRDLRKPTVNLALGGLHADTTIATGEPLTLQVTASDNLQLQYVGWEGGGRRDSVAVSSRSVSHTFSLAVPAAWRSQRPLIYPWARDASGNLSPTENARWVPVYDWTERTVAQAPLPQGRRPQVVWDGKRSTLYLLRQDIINAETRSSIDAVHVPSATALAPIALPNEPYGLTLSETGDSLIVSIPYIRTLGFVDLQSPGQPLSLVEIEADSQLRAPANVRAIGGRLFVSMVSGQSISRLLDFDLATGTRAVRDDVDGGSDVTANPAFHLLPDGRLAIVPQASPYAIGPMFVYLPASNSFVRTGALKSATSSQFSSATTERFLMGNTVFRTTFHTVRTLQTQDWDAGVSAITPDGSAAYLATRYGYEKVSVSDGSLLEQVKLPIQPLFLVALPDGTRLIAVGESGVYIVDVR